MVSVEVAQIRLPVGAVSRPESFGIEETQRLNHDLPANSHRKQSTIVEILTRPRHNHSPIDCYCETELAVPTQFLPIGGEVNYQRIEGLPCARHRIKEEGRESATVTIQSNEPMTPLERRRSSMMSRLGIATSVPVPAIPKETKPEIVYKKAGFFTFASTQDKLMAAVGLLINFISGAMLPVSVLFSGKFLDAVGSRDTTAIDFWTGLQALVGVVSFFISWLGTTLLEWSAENQLARIKAHFYHAVLNQDQQFKMTFDSGELADVLMQNGQAFRSAVGSKLGQLMILFAQFSAGYVIALSLHWRLGLILALMLPVLLGSGAFTLWSMAASGRKMRETYTTAAAIVEETLANIRTVIAYGLEEVFTNKYFDAIDLTYEVAKRGAVMLGIGMGVSMGSIFAFYALGFWAQAQMLMKSYQDGCDGVSPGCLTVGTGISVFFCIAFGSFSLGQASQPLNAFVKGRDALANLTTIINRKSQIPTLTKHGKHGFYISGAIVFRNVGFGYNMAAAPTLLTAHPADIPFPGTPRARLSARGVLPMEVTVAEEGVQEAAVRLNRFASQRADTRRTAKATLAAQERGLAAQPHQLIFAGVHLHINAGESMAFVGPSGCGKSTIAKLMMRFVDVSEGSIELDGYDIRDTDINYLRGNIGYVGQEPQLFSDTVANNIRHGYLEATDEEVVEAAELANAHGFIKALPHGYQTEIGEEGSRLSGGQRQRLAIARALIRRPQILILDEATSALDNNSEKIVQANIQELQKTRKLTLLVIAHRLSTIRNANRIVVFQTMSNAGVHNSKVKAFISEIGNHEELLSKRGVYASLVRAQGGEVPNDTLISQRTPTQAGHPQLVSGDNRLDSGYDESRNRSSITDSHRSRKRVSVIFSPRQFTRSDKNDIEISSPRSSTQQVADEAIRSVDHHLPRDNTVLVQRISTPADGNPQVAVPVRTAYNATAIGERAIGRGSGSTRNNAESVVDIGQPHRVDLPNEMSPQVTDRNSDHLIHGWSGVISPREEVNALTSFERSEGSRLTLSTSRMFSPEASPQGRPPKRTSGSGRATFQSGVRILHESIHGSTLPFEFMEWNPFNPVYGRLHQSVTTVAPTPLDEGRAVKQRKDRGSMPSLMARFPSKGPPTTARYRQMSHQFAPPDFELFISPPTDVSDHVPEEPDSWNSSSSESSLSSCYSSQETIMISESADHRRASLVADNVKQSAQPRQGPVTGIPLASAQKPMCSAYSLQTAEFNLDSVDDDTAVPVQNFPKSDLFFTWGGSIHGAAARTLSARSKSHEECGFESSNSSDANMLVRLEPNDFGDFLGGAEASKRRALKYMKPKWIVTLLGMLGSALNGLIFPLFAWCFARFVKAMSLGSSAEISAAIGAPTRDLLLVALAALLFNFIQFFLLETSGQSMVQAIRISLYAHCVRLPAAFFDHPNLQPGYLLNALSVDALLIKGWASDNVAIVLQNLVTVIAAVLIATVADWKLALVSIAGFCAMAPAVFLERKFMAGGRATIKRPSVRGFKDRKGSKAIASRKEYVNIEEQKEVSTGLFKNAGDTTSPITVIGMVNDDETPECQPSRSSTQLLIETLKSTRTVDAFNLQPVLAKKYDNLLVQERNQGHKTAVVAGFFYGLSQFCQFGSQALALWYGGRSFASGRITDTGSMLQGTFTLVIAAFGLGQASTNATDNANGKAAAVRVFSLMNTPVYPDVQDSHGELFSPDEPVRDFELKGLRFQFPTAQAPVYDSLTFKIPAGSSVALVGESGCGKTTLIQLIERFYELPSNQECLYISGKEIRKWNIRSLRRRISLVSQEPILFSDTVANNIRYGKLDATTDQIVQAAKMANAHEFIVQLPGGYDYAVGIRGEKLSGGQRQRIAIARALLRPSDVLLLDEATSALDPVSERIVQETLDKILATSCKTAFIVAHRLSTVRKCSYIVVLKKAIDANTGSSVGSRVAEIGTHDQLMTIPDGEYRRLVDASNAH